MPLFLMKLELKIRSLRGLNKPKYIQCGNVALGLDLGVNLFSFSCFLPKDHSLMFCTLEDIRELREM
ncbi:unnamed protein product [Arabidopsis lyrata]|nr:unnamed protein product [Arabidopsis lyrata]